MPERLGWRSDSAGSKKPRDAAGVERDWANTDGGCVMQDDSVTRTRAQGPSSSSAESELPSDAEPRAWVRRLWVAFLVAFGIGAALLLTSCNDDERPTGPDAPDPALVMQGQGIFRYDTYGNETFWTDTLRMHEVIQRAVDPATALAVGLKVDADTLPQAVKDALRADQVDLKSPAITVALLKLGAVVRVRGTVNTVNGKDTLVRVGITCALCHSSVDNSFAPGIRQ